MDNPALASTLLPPKQNTNRRNNFFKKVRNSDHNTSPAKNEQKHSNTDISVLGISDMYLDDESTQDSLSQFTFSISPSVTPPPSFQPQKTEKKKKKNIFSFGNFSRRVSMTPYDVSYQEFQGNNGPREGDPTDFDRNRRATATSTTSKNSKSSLISPDVQNRYQNDLKTWIMTTTLNKNYKHDDPLTYAPERLTTFLETYELVLEKQRTGSSGSNYSNTSATVTSIKSNTSGASGHDLKCKNRHDSLPSIKEVPKAPLKLCEKFDLIGFWSLSALKFISNVDIYFTENLVTEFSNYDLKKNEKIRVFNTQGEFFGLQWGWQLALDNPKAEIYNFTLSPIIPTSYSDYRQTIGPSNFHPIHGESFTDLSFSKNSFAFAVAYDLWLQLKNYEWVPVLSEIHRVLVPSGTIHMLLLDFDIVNCENLRYQRFFSKLQKVLTNNDIDPFPCKHIQQRLKESGFQSTRYSLISLKKGLPNNMGNLMEFLQSYFEFIIFEKLASLHMDQEDIQDYKELKLQYHQETKAGRLLNEFGSSYCMFVFAKKG